MCITCTTKVCQATSTNYCNDHKKAICSDCKFDIHSQCKVEHLLSVKELQYQVTSLDKLLNSIKTAFNDFCLEDFHPKFENAIADAQNEFEVLKKETLQAIEEKAFLKFEELGTKLRKLRVFFSSNEAIMKVMGEAFQLSILKQKQIGALQTSKSNKKCDSVEDKLSKNEEEKIALPQNNLEKTQNEEDLDISEDITVLERLRRKYLGCTESIDLSHGYHLNCEDKGTFDFMNESIHCKAELPKMKEFIFYIHPKSLALLKDYIEECVPEEFCDEITFTTNHKETSIEYKHFSTCIQKILKNPPHIIKFLRVRFYHEELLSFKELISLSNIKLKLENCTVWKKGIMYSQMITKKDIAEYSLDSAITTD